MVGRISAFTTLVILTILSFLAAFGVVAVWITGNIINVRQVLPYTIVFTIAVLISNVAYAAVCALKSPSRCERCNYTTCRCLSVYTPVVVIAGIIALIVMFMILVTMFPLNVKIILAFIVSWAFIEMVLCFLASAICLITKRC